MLKGTFVIGASIPAAGWTGPSHGPGYVQRVRSNYDLNARIAALYAAETGRNPSKRFEPGTLASAQWLYGIPRAGFNTKPARDSVLAESRVS